MLKRKEIIDKMSEKGYTKKDAGTIIDDFVSVIMEQLVAGESIQLHGFGTFEVREIAPHEITDFQTKEKVVLPATKTPKFTAGKLLKRAIKEGIIRE